MYNTTGYTVQVDASLNDLDLLWVAEGHDFVQCHRDTTFNL